MRDIFELSVSHYSEVRSYAQDLLFKLGNRVVPESHSLIIPLLVDCLKPGVSHQKFKGNLLKGIDNRIFLKIGNFKVALAVYICSLLSNTQLIRKQNGSELQ